MEKAGRAGDERRFAIDLTSADNKIAAKLQLRRWFRRHSITSIADKLKFIGHFV